MSKIYLSSLFLTFTISVFSQQEQQTNRQLFIASATADANMIPVHDGDVITIRTNIAISRKKPLLTNILKAVGLATATYQSGKLIHAAGKVDGQSNNTNWLLPVGVGIAIAADRITSKIPSQALYLKYLLYTKDKTFVSEETIKIDSRLAKTNDPFSISRAVSIDGFIKLLLVTKERKIISDGTDLVVNVESLLASKPKEESAEISLPSRSTDLKIYLRENIIPFNANSLEISNAPQFITPGNLINIIKQSKSKKLVKHKELIQRITPETELGNNQTTETQKRTSNRNGKLNLNTKIPVKQHQLPPIIPPFILPRRHIITKHGEDEGDESGEDNDEDLLNTPIVNDEYPSFDGSYSYDGSGGGGGGGGDFSDDNFTNDPYDPCLNDPCSCDPTLPGCGSFYDPNSDPNAAADNCIKLCAATLKSDLIAATEVETLALIACAATGPGYPVCATISAAVYAVAVNSANERFNICVAGCKPA